MGSFYSTCSVSHMTLTNQKTSILLLVPGYSQDFQEHKNMIVSNDGSQAFFSPFGFPIHGEYDDYGHIYNIKRDKNVEMLEEYFGVDIETILNNIGDDRDIPDELKNKEFYLTLAKTYFRTEVLEYLEQGWDKFNLENPTKYSSSERVNTLLKLLEKRSNKKVITTKERDELYEKMRNKTLTEDERYILMEDLRDGNGGYDFNKKTYIATLANENMFSVLPITMDFKEEIMKQYCMLINLGWKLRRILLPSDYGSQDSNWTELYNFNNFVNELLVEDIRKSVEDHKRWGNEASNEEMDIISHHHQVKRDRKINMLID